MFLPAKGALKSAIRMYLVGTRGGPVRLSILLLLMNKPHNLNELAKKLQLDYKTVEYHMRVLDKSDFVTSSKEKYANMYSLSELLKSNIGALKELGKTR